MATPQKGSLEAVTAREQAALERLARSSSERVDRMRRATALLAVVHRDGFAAAARQAGFASSTTVAELVARLNRRGLAAVSIAAGRGRKPTDDEPARSVATAQRAPERKTDGPATWSLSTLEHTLRREAFPRLGASTIRRVLEAAGSSYQKTRIWCPTGTAERKRKSGIVRVTDHRTEEKSPDARAGSTGDENGGRMCQTPTAQRGRDGRGRPSVLRARKKSGPGAAREHRLSLLSRKHVEQTL